MPRRIDPAEREPRDHHRGLVHRLWKMRGALSLRQHKYASSRGDEGSPDGSEIAESQYSADGEDRKEEVDDLQSEHLRPLHAVVGAELRLRLSARCCETGRSAALLW